MYFNACLEILNLNKGALVFRVNLVGEIGELVFVAGVSRLYHLLDHVEIVL